VSKYAQRAIPLVGMTAFWGHDDADDQDGWDAGICVGIHGIVAVFLSWGFGRWVPLRPWPALRTYRRGRLGRLYVVLAWAGFCIAVSPAIYRRQKGGAE